MPGLMDKLKGAAGAAKDKVDTMVDKAGEKMPPKVKQTYEKVSDKVEKVIPGKKDSDADEQPPRAAAAEATRPSTGRPTGEAAADGGRGRTPPQRRAEEAATSPLRKPRAADSTLPKGRRQPTQGSLPGDA